MFQKIFLPLATATKSDRQPTPNPNFFSEVHRRQLIWKRDLCIQFEIRTNDYPLSWSPILGAHFPGFQKSDQKVEKLPKIA